MNIDEVESGKGLRFLPSGHWPQDVVKKLIEMDRVPVVYPTICERVEKLADEYLALGAAQAMCNVVPIEGIIKSEGMQNMTVDYFIELEKWARKNMIVPVNGFYHFAVDRKLSRWHYQQRRVRARREKHQKRIDQIKKSLPRAVILRRDHKARFGKVVKFTISEEALKPWQL